MTELRLLVEEFSKRWGGKYLLTSQPSTPQALVLDTSGAHTATNSGIARVFPVIPKVHTKLVQLWFKSILPTLPRILSAGLGGNYAASIVRRGQSDLGAKPCIQIESPCLPGPKARRIINDSVNDICKEYGYEPISMHFVEGSVKKLNGEETGDDDDDGKGEELQQRLEFNYSRPYSKPGMGASAGLLCSKKISATLGGYVLIGGEKYILTSKHFVSESRQPINRDGNECDCETLTSPSRYDLNKIENNLKQTKRDLNGEIKWVMSRDYIHRPISADPNDITPDLRDLMRRRDEVESLLDQVTKPPSEYAVGTVTKISLEGRTEKISRSMANDVGLQNDQLKVKHQMDWALFKTNSQTAQTGENRHKYRSNEDARNDHYVDELNHANQPGDVCHETCGAESGYTVYYVGQRSKHRVGKVHMPTLVREGSSETLDWAISDEDGRGIPYSDVAGDSGAWVIRTEGNKLMGQVHSYSATGRVLFTPIDVIFADLAASCGSEVSLPPCPPDLRQVSSATFARPMCSVPQTPPVRAYRYMLPHVASRETSPTDTSLPGIKPLEPSTQMTSPSNTKTAHGRRSPSTLCESPSSLPGLTESPQSSATTPDYPRSPQSNRGADSADAQVDLEKLLSDSLPTILVDPAISEIPDLSLDKHGEIQPVDVGSDALKYKEQPLFRMTSSTRTPTWPTDSRSRGTKIRRGLASREYAMPYSVRSAFDQFAQFARFARKIGTCSHPP